MLYIDTRSPVHISQFFENDRKNNKFLYYKSQHHHIYILTLEIQYVTYIFIQVKIHVHARTYAIYITSISLQI